MYQREKFVDKLTVAHLRQRARHYRALADKAKDPARAAHYQEIADVLDREADAIREEEAQRLSAMAEDPLLAKPKSAIGSS